MEEWREISGFEGRYEVSNLGRVRSIDHKTPTKGNASRVSPGRILSQCIGNTGRPRVHLSKPGFDGWFSVHRLVAFAFCQGYFEGAVVNHKDEDKRNNNADNLEWCTQSYNCKYGHRNDAMINQRKKAVSQFTEGGILIRTFGVLNEASRVTGINAAHICDVCNGKRRKAGGFVWRYAE